MSNLDMRDILQGKLYQNFVRRFYKIALAGSNTYNGSKTSLPPMAQYLAKMFSFKKASIWITNRNPEFDLFVTG